MYQVGQIIEKFINHNEVVPLFEILSQNGKSLKNYEKY